MNITNRYLGELEQIIAGEIDMWPFTRKKVEDLSEVKENVDGRFNQSRRDFLKSGAKGAVALAAMGAGGTAYDIATSILDKENKLTNDAHAYDFSKLPPGIANCRDKWIPIIYGDLVERLWRIPKTQYSINGILTRQYLTTPEMNISEETPYLEPALYLLFEKIKEPDNFNLNEEKLRNENPQLWYFKGGLKMYFNLWVKRIGFKTGSSPGSIEENFIKSIFTAAYETHTLGLEEANKYINLETNEEKAVILNGLMDRFSKMSKDKTSIDPNNGYNRCLVAAWSSFMLTVHYDKIKKNSPESYLSYIIEKQIRNYIPKIRGPPNYGI